MNLERRGVPTVFLCPEAFRGIVKAQARLDGMPSYEPVTVPGQVVALSPQQVLAKIDGAADRIVGGLLSAPSES